MMPKPKMSKDDFLDLVKSNDPTHRQKVKGYLQSDDPVFLGLFAEVLLKELQGYCLSELKKSYPGLSKKRLMDESEEIAREFLRKYNRIKTGYDPTKASLYSYLIGCVKNQWADFFRSGQGDHMYYCISASYLYEKQASNDSDESYLEFLDKNSFNNDPEELNKKIESIDDQGLEVLGHMKKLFDGWTEEKKYAFSVMISSDHGDKGKGYKDAVNIFNGGKEGTYRSLASRASKEIEKYLKQYVEKRGLNRNQVEPAVRSFFQYVRGYYNDRYAMQRWGAHR
ncbi:MAG: hypothetical protein KatS3mg026_1116 [Bacteroidia bacterium]|nr:MAG: hypothetical protein KatS3mg026_1116 [Bacteroidia bacterium]